MASDTRKRFNEEFKAARNSGAEQFEFEGKKYSTKMGGKESNPPIKIPKSMRNLPDSYESADPRDAEGELSRGSRKDDPAYERPARPQSVETGNKLKDHKEEAKATQQERRQVQKENESFSYRMGPKSISGMQDVTSDTQSFAKGGTASARGDGIAQRGKTKGTMVMCGGGMAKK